MSLITSSSNIRLPEHAVATCPTSSQSPYESNFLKEIRMSNPHIPSDFFSSQEETLIQSMFQRQLLASLTLLDLLGFEFYSTMETLILANQEIHKSKDSFNPLLEEFCKGYFAFFIRIFKDNHTENSSNLTAHDERLLKLKDLEGLLEALCKTLGNQSKENFQKALSSKQKPDIEGVRTKYRAALNSYARLNDLKNLWVKIIHSPFCSFLLIGISLWEFPGHEKLNTISEVKTANNHLSSLPSLSSIRPFFDFLGKCCLQGGKLFGCVYGFIPGLQQILNSYLNQPITHDFIQQWHEGFHSATATAISSRISLQNELLQAGNGDLTHQQWLKLHQVRASRKKTPEEFVDGLNLSLLNLLINEAWLEDIYQIVEVQIICPYFPDSYRSKFATLTKIFQNLSTLQTSDLENKPLPRPTSTLPKEISELLISLQKEVKKACQPFYDLIQQPEHNKFIRFVLSRDSLAGISYAAIYSRLSHFFSDSGLLDRFETGLGEIRQHYHEKLVTFVKTIPPLYRGDWIQNVVESCSIQVGEVFFVLTTFNDIKTILKHNTFIEDLDYLIHPSVRDFLQLPADVEDLLRTVPYEAPPQVTLTVEEPKPVQTAVQPDYHEFLAQLKTATKRREFKKVLKKLNFYFLRQGTGSHEVWSSTNGTNIVLPFHNGRDELRLGTQHAIVKQVASSLNSDKLQ